MSPSTVIVIPARYGSTRLPGKPLLPLCGKPLIQWVYERARQSTRAAHVRVATDDQRILEAVRAFGGEAVMTREDHPSGTDRIAEAVQDIPAAAVINVQGDEPLIEPALIDALADALTGPDPWDMVTAATPIRSAEELRNPAVVKVVWGAEHRALYFSREPIPHIRDARGDAQVLAAGLHWRHIGVYGYRRGFLEAVVRSSPCALEQAEKLEQLRALHLGARMKVIESAHFGLGVDTPEDVPRAEAALRAAGLA
ncbi:MAG TPA: 3-deoxy-manno-octulosonate cytidylyltransferase [Kiritimatiellia bacterium]|nr:3-deoxy-manno-octulosonate cytidylyltransferase [Kiritimatiellia bacterium]